MTFGLDKLTLRATIVSLLMAWLNYIGEAGYCFSQSYIFLKLSSKNYEEINLP